MKTLFVVVVIGLLGAQETRPFFPFSLSMEGAPDTVVDWSWMNEAPAGSLGPVRLRDGHFYTGQRRLRWAGVNLHETPPTLAEMEKLAAHLARFGVNIVRFHHIDSNWVDGVFGPASYEGRRVDLQPAYMERLIQFLEVLGRKGIYINMNLLAGRWFTSADGLPREIDRIEEFKVRHALGFWYRPLLELQKRYARDLLNYRNRSGAVLKNLQNLAVVEVNNEAGLIHSWQLGYLDELPPVFADDLKRQWNSWLMRHGGDAAWRRASVGVQAPDPGFEQAVWNLEQHEGARARFDSSRGLRIDIDRAGSEDWHVQITRAPLDLVADGLYSLEFEVRTDAPSTLWVALAYNRPPWTDLGWAHSVEADREWKTVRLQARVLVTEKGARLVIGGLGNRKGWVEIRNLRFAAPTPDNRLVPLPSRNQVPLVKKSESEEKPRAVQSLWLNFLRETEEGYWREMVEYLKRDLGITTPIAATITPTTSPHLSRLWDFADNHFYWQHPEFPVRAWDRDNYTVGNDALVRSPNLGGLVALASLREAGRAYTVSEYGHPAPNLFAAEGLVFCSALASVQDWDGYYSYAYEDPSRRPGIRDYFDVVGHPTVWATVGPMSQVFRQRLLKPSVAIQMEAFPRHLEDDLREWYAWEGPNIRSHVAKFDPAEVWFRQIGYVPSGESVVRSGPREGNIDWDPRSGLFSIAVKKAVLLSGFLAGKSGENGPLRWRVLPNRSGWGQILLLEVKPERWLLVAHGVARPKGMYEPLPALGARIDGPFWEKPEVEVEPLLWEARLDLPGTYRVWALDGRGARMQELSTSREGRFLVVNLGREPTLWYEVARR